MNQNKKRYIVTGGAGFIGSHLVDRLIYNNHEVVVIDDLSSGHEKNISTDLSIPLIKKQVQEITNENVFIADGIFHLAAQASVPYSINNFYNSSENNILSTLKVFEWSNNQNIPIIYASSSAVYGNIAIGDDTKIKSDVASPYAQDKLSMEHYAKMCWNLYKVPSIGLRFFNVYGPRQEPSNPYSGAISIFIDKLLKNKPVTVNWGLQTRDFIYVMDIVEVIIKSMEYLFNNKSCEVFNVATGLSITINDLLSMLSNIMGIQPEIIHKHLPSGDPKQSCGTNMKMKEILNINTDLFVSLEDGLKNTIKYIEGNKSQ